MSIRNYSNDARPLSLSVRAESDDVLIQVNAPGTSDYPDPPFLLAAERGTVREEIMLCTDKTSNSFTVSRGFDGTDAAVHEAGSVIEHTVAAIDFREANQHVNNAGNNHRLTGEVIAYAAPVTAGTEPAGWLLCDGRVVSRTTYAALFAIMGTNYNIGSGETNADFRLPDFRQAFPMGKAASGTGSVLGGKGGFKDAAIITHSHQHTDNGHNHTQNGHNHGGGDHNHGLYGGRHAHAMDGDYGFRFAITAGIQTNERLTTWANGSGVGITFSDVDTEDILNPGPSGESPSALGINPATAGNDPQTATNNAHAADIDVGNPDQANVAGTDRNLPPFQTVNYLVKT